jgi:hypothetical protein
MLKQGFEGFGVLGVWGFGKRFTDFKDLGCHVSGKKMMSISVQLRNLAPNCQLPTAHC